MTSFDEKKHFEDYREQTQVEHDILAAYLRPYFHILKTHSDNLIYIDAFAGRGTYTRAETGETVDGSCLAGTHRVRLATLARSYALHPT
jgi:three-Cys-motif partner protein